MVTKPVLSHTLTPARLRPPKFHVPQTLNCQLTVTVWASKRQHSRISDTSSTISLQTVTALSVHSLDPNLGLTLHCSLSCPTSGNQDMSCLLWINAVSAAFTLLRPPVLSHGTTAHLLAWPGWYEESSDSVGPVCIQPPDLWLTSTCPPFLLLSSQSPSLPNRRFLGLVCCLLASLRIHTSLGHRVNLGAVGGEEVSILFSAVFPEPGNV